MTNSTQTIIAPSILACDFLNMESELKSLEGIENLWIHLDIMDGHFVPNLTFGPPIIKMIADRFDFILDAHLMVDNPEFHIETMKDYRLHNLTFHFEVTKNKTLKLIEKAKKYYPSVGLSIKPKTEVDEISEEILKNLDLILVMSVEPGFGGQGFIPESLDKVRKLKEMREKNGYHYQIQIDGGIKDINSKEVIEAGAQNLVAGSYIFKQRQDQYSQAVDSLR